MLSKSFDEKMSIAMARGTVVLDENLLNLRDGLQKRNIRVLVPTSGMSDETIKEQMLANRILITNNSKDFISDASSYDYGIIATESLSSKDIKNVVQKIHEAFITHELWSKRHGFIVYLKDTGPSDFKSLTV